MKSMLAFIPAKAFATIRSLVDATPYSVQVNNVVKLWDKSRFLNTRAYQIQHGFVYIHLPKTAGTSLQKALRLKDSGDSVSHTPIKEIMPMIRRLLPRVVFITCVRNPYTRFISLYNFARQGETYYHSVKNPAKAPGGKHVDYDILSDKNLEQCAELLLQGKLGNIPTDTIPFWRPQVDWLVDWQGKLMVDFIGRIETLDSDLKRLQTLHGIASDPVPWLNKSTDTENIPQFTERTRDLVRLYYKRDFEMLGYDE